MKILASIGAVVLLLALLLAGYFLYTPHGQDLALARLSNAAMSTASEPVPDALSVFVCGSSSPLPDPSRAQACIAVITPHHFFIVDAGAGSAVNLLAGNLPLARLDGILLTHFHSDHIAAIPDMNLNSWVQGRPQPLTIYGPTGVDKVVDGLNLAYQLDRGYRVAHHGEDIMAPALGVLTHKEIEPGTVFEGDELKVTTFMVDHKPITPAVGYHFEYKGRTVAVTGDTVVSESLERAVNGVDLLFADAISLPIVRTLEAAARSQGRERNAAILFDIQDYHAPVEDVVALTERANIGMAALYHLVPPPRNLLMENIFKRGLPGNVILTQDRQWFTLPAASKQITVH